ncbi:phosphoenolpyruvate--protein phosphotransferase [Mycoplasmopsis pullorum]|uniref:phosphoenolpyruvate--protein phosphotransferase n=1 Tax=Mycoplasmopsis pullorum TaxID=48003 RepID=UPI00111A0DBE|nr:phosphoenolpyruvate--protein phosphotransferase [Mycoplasmopsis pullorum]TNK82671.1 phosphoenolpyruvate--protein phosphotransferase [Mycoplasmopsis pullorum]TNK83445.1 phosphoenolpyruvate--protein phosphotransferase [Mycoplasmopsis pullorum]TNK85189.1 phosphoenolpyruvate--protein phosphotransferase [Mycoplasmopsis pullorum]TNK85690.1 phosphoenolpyruvate--protein phosphotransferase [Mycoplasmopsis pullorum]TNK86105.1 phosphoenolpyruvate--protein phosphotransferase [Mycoplasmopsis pullorum]
MKIKGIGASKGVAISKVFKIEELPLEITKNAQNPELELQKYQDAQEAVMVKINKAKDLAKDPEHAAIFEAHLNFVIDPYAVDSINNMIKNENLSAEYAVKNFYDEFANMFAMMDDEYMRERAADVKDVAKKILYVLNGIEEPNLSEISEEVVIVAEDLSPSQTVQLDKKYVKGFVTNIGGPTSHTAIMARSLGIPSVVGTNNILELVKNGDVIALNGDKGEVVVNPSAEEIEHFKEEMVKYEQYLSRLALLKGRQSQTLDNHHIEIAANIGTPSDLQSVLDNDAEGIGLFRSEFLYMDNEHWPTEEEQYQAYKKVLEGMNGKRVVIRTLDIGGDKTLKYFKFPEEMNPFLGYRAIRFCLNNLDIFKTQLRALVRASAHGKLGIMIPMVTNVPEFLEAKKVFEEVYNELQSEGANIASRENIEFGLMMETPAAAVLSDQFCKHADFVSIGTNDLIQYSMAADRMNENISYLYQPLNPSILRLVKLIIDGAHKHGKWAGMCGEMAGDRRAMPLLIGLGLDEFSMSASNVLAARELASKLSYAQMQELANKAIELESEVEVAQLLEKELNI